MADDHLGRSSTVQPRACQQCVQFQAALQRGKQAGRLDGKSMVQCWSFAGVASKTGSGGHVGRRDQLVDHPQSDLDTKVQEAVSLCATFSCETVAVGSTLHRAIAVDVHFLRGTKSNR